MAPRSDLTLAEMRLALAPAIAAEAVFDGWSNTALASAAAAQGIAPEAAQIAFPGGAMDMIAAWIDSVDAAMQARFTRDELVLLPIRQRIRTLVSFRIEAVAAQREALRRALGIMAMPQNVSRALKLGWRSADAMWRLAGDMATDYNHYTKRMTLGALYAATLTVLVDDKSEGLADTYAFLDRRIEGVMRFEKAKARLLAGDDAHFSPARFLGRLRYPAR